MARNKYDVDETLETKFDMKQIKRLFSYVGHYRKKLIMTIMLMLFSSALGMVIPVLMQRVMDIYIPNHDKKGILLMAALAALIIMATAYILRIKIKWTSQIGQGIIHELRRELFIHLEELPFSYYDSRPHGKIQVRIVNYVNNISDLLSNGIVNTITDCCSLFFILGFMFYYSVPLTLICMCGLPILLAIVLFVKKKQRRGWQLASNKQSNLNAYIAESINGVRVTQAFVREDKNLGIFNNLSGSYRKAWMSVIKYNFMIGPTVQFISILATAAVYWVGIHWIMGGNDIISVGALTALTIYISQFWNPINTLASFYNSLLTAISYLERIFETIDEPVNVKDAPGAVEMPPIKGEVEFSHVVFSYEPGVYPDRFRPALQAGTAPLQPLLLCALFFRPARFRPRCRNIPGFRNAPEYPPHKRSVCSMQSPASHRMPSDHAKALPFRDTAHFRICRLQKTAPGTSQLPPAPAPP